MKKRRTGAVVLPTSLSVALRWDACFFSPARSNAVGTAHGSPWCKPEFWTMLT